MNAIQKLGVNGIPVFSIIFVISCFFLSSMSFLICVLFIPRSFGPQIFLPLTITSFAIQSPSVSFCGSTGCIMQQFSTDLISTNR